MKYVVLTNFNDYDSKISCDNYGIITLKLIPKRINDIRLKDNYFKKKRGTLLPN